MAGRVARCRRWRRTAGTVAARLGGSPARHGCRGVWHRLGRMMAARAWDGGTAEVGDGTANPIRWPAPVDRFLAGGATAPRRAGKEEVRRSGRAEKTPELGKKTAPERHGHRDRPARVDWRPARAVRGLARASSRFFFFLAEMVAWVSDFFEEEQRGRSKREISRRREKKNQEGPGERKPEGKRKRKEKGYFKTTSQLHFKNIKGFFSHRNTCPYKEFLHRL